MADPTPQTFRLAAGQAKTLVITMDPPGSISGQTARFRMRVPAAAVAGGLVEKTVGDGVTRADADDGVWEVELLPADSEDLRGGSYPWSFWDADAGEESPIAYGTCEVYRTAETG